MSAVLPSVLAAALGWVTGSAASMQGDRSIYLPDSQELSLVVLNFLGLQHDILDGVRLLEEVGKGSYPPAELARRIKEQRNVISTLAEDMKIEGSLLQAEIASALSSLQIIPWSRGFEIAPWKVLPTSGDGIHSVIPTAGSTLAVGGKPSTNPRIYSVSLRTHHRNIVHRYKHGTVYLEGKSWGHRKENNTPLPDGNYSYYQNADTSDLRGRLHGIDPITGYHVGGEVQGAYNTITKIGLSGGHYAVPKASIQFGLILIFDDSMTVGDMQAVFASDQTTFTEKLISSSGNGRWPVRISSSGQMLTRRGEQQAIAIARNAVMIPRRSFHVGEIGGYSFIYWPPTLKLQHALVI